MNDVISSKKTSINDIYNSKQYRQYSRHKLIVIWTLIGITLAFYFSVPVLNFLAPGMMNYRITGSVNVGLIWVIMQYPLGGLIACYYVKKMRQLDNHQWPETLTDRSSF
ncbi:DUF485 domain-containing protein [Tatumella citrea]|uniref:DUF485 domain-containing protein n=1 Tax=Tatumella citrea TaxID=53336 RepID=A0A1Y0L8I6_TATCI|nr:DUF485 domain-containing protein [Tatumella citrea]ARU94020.1 hypothetical protein A7K98_09685 [Tatumella citrea]ARU98058.1 hypothetical protein A7K99_09685 [Tatumella citrea]